MSGVVREEDGVVIFRGSIEGDLEEVRIDMSGWAEGGV